MPPCLKMSFSVARAKGHRYLRPGLKVIVIISQSSRSLLSKAGALKVLVIRGRGLRSSLSATGAPGRRYPNPGLKVVIFRD
jgi:hypothetical protein